VTPRHHLLRQPLIVETFIGIVEKPASEERMLEKPLAGPADNLQRLLDDGDPLHIKPLQPSTRFCRRWPLRHMGGQSFPLDDKSVSAHFLIDPSPDGVERAEGRERQDQPDRPAPDGRSIRASPQSGSGAGT
jgi:hypothetical protein